MTGVRYVSAWDQGRRDMGAHWVKEGVTGSKAAARDNTLDSLMEMDHVIRVDDAGLVWDDVSGVYAPEMECGTDKDGQILDVHERGMVDYLKRQGWEPERGWSSQQGAKGSDVVMHCSEFVGGKLAEHILSTPGLWVVCELLVGDESGERDYDNPGGWVVMHQGIGQ